MNYISKLHTNCMLVLLIVLSSIIFNSCSKESDNEPEPGQSLGIVSIPNLRDMGGYKTANGATIARGLVYRSNQLYNISTNDMLLLANLNLKNDFDLCTATERNDKPDELPVGVNNVWLDVLADDPTSGPANLISLSKVSETKKAEPTKTVNSKKDMFPIVGIGALLAKFHAFYMLIILYLPPFYS